MKFLWCTIHVEDMERSLRFYEEIVGLKVEKRLASGSNGEIVFLGDNQTKVELIYDNTTRQANSFKGISLGFEVECLDDMIEFIKLNGIQIEKGPIQPNPNVKFFFVKDPNGLHIQFVENIK
jgi:lactoylglutathione lyase